MDTTTEAPASPAEGAVMLDYRRPSLHARRMAEMAEDKALVLRAEADAARTREIAPDTMMAQLATDAAADSRAYLEHADAETDRELHDYWRSRVLTEAQAVAALATVATRLASYSQADGSPRRPARGTRAVGG